MTTVRTPSRQENLNAKNARARGEGNARQVQNVSAAINRTEQIRLDSLRNRRDMEQVLDERLAPSPTQAAEQRHARAFDAYIRRGMIRGAEYRDMGEATGAAGGFTVAPSFNAEFVKDMTAMSALFGHTRIVDTSADLHPGSPMNFPTLIDRTAVAAALGENVLRTSTDPVFGNIAWPAAQEYVAGEFARVGFGLAADAGFDLQSVLSDAWAIRTARGVEQDMTAALIAGITQSVVLTGTTAPYFTYASLLAAWTGIDAAYRADAIFVVSPTAMLQLLSVADSNGRPLLLTDYARDTGSDGAVQMSPTLFGCKVLESNGGWSAMAGSGSGVVGAFINVGRVLPVRYAGSSVTVLRERFADQGELGYSGFARFNATTLALTAAAVLIKNHV